VGFHTAIGGPAPASELVRTPSCFLTTPPLADKFHQRTKWRHAQALDRLGPIRWRAACLDGSIGTNWIRDLVRTERSWSLRLLIQGFFGALGTDQELAVKTRFFPITSPPRAGLVGGIPPLLFDVAVKRITNNKRQHSMPCR